MIDVQSWHRETVLQQIPNRDFLAEPFPRLLDSFSFSGQAAIAVPGLVATVEQRIFNY